jgi:hypothetical protein
MTPKEFIKTCEDGALEALLTDMVGRGFGTPTLEAIKNNITQTSYDEFAKIIAKSLNIDFDNIRNDTRLYDYITDLSKDITNQYSAIRQLLITNDLKLNWFRYSGSNLTTTRPFCLAMTEKQYFHQCEISKIIEGDFPEFEKQNDILYEESGTPSGFYSHIDETNFFIYRGGYGCGHRIMPISDSSVPDYIKAKLYETQEYKEWKQNNS